MSLHDSLVRLSEALRSLCILSIIEKYITGARTGKFTQPVSSTGLF